MPIKIKEVRADMLSQYAEIPIAFEVTSVLQIDLINDGLGGIKLREEKVERPYIKDYDACEDSERPKRWPKRFDVSNWGFFIARLCSSGISTYDIYQKPGHIFIP